MWTLPARSIRLATLLAPVVTMIAASIAWGGVCPDGGPEGRRSPVRRLFSAIPPPREDRLEADRSTRSTSFTCAEWRPVVTIPALRVTQSTRANAVVDAFLLTSVGGGLSWQRLRWNAARRRYDSTFSVSPATVLLAGRIAGDNVLDVSYAATVGFFNNLLMVGTGYDLGTVKGRSRWFGLLSVGINFNN
jgi:hypothetical protein